MKSSYKIVLIILFLTQNALPQDSLILSGYLFSEDLNKMLTFTEIEINNTQVKTNSIGSFKFKGVKGEEYQIDYVYPFHYPESNKLILISDTSILLGLVMWDAESIKNDTTTVLTNHEYGFAPYDELIQQEGTKYGINWEFHGCVVEEDYSYFNEVNKAILEIRNGEGWEGNFWYEVHKLRKQERKRNKKVFILKSR